MVDLNRLHSRQERRLQLAHGLHLSSAQIHDQRADRRHRHRTANGLFALSHARAGDESPTLLLKIDLSSGEWLRNDPPSLPPTGTIRSCRRSLSWTLRLRDHDRGAMIRYVRRSGGIQEPGQRLDGRISQGFRDSTRNFRLFLTNAHVFISQMSGLRHVEARAGNQVTAPRRGVAPPRARGFTLARRRPENAMFTRG
jgi:hypothetical protein